MNEENMEALARVRAHGQALKNGAPHQQPIGDDILQLCDLVAVGQPADPTNADVARLTKERDDAREERDNLLTKLVSVTEERDVLKEQCDKADGEIAELKANPNGLSAAAEPVGGRVLGAELHAAAHGGPIGTGGETKTSEAKQKAKSKK